MKVIEFEKLKAGEISRSAFTVGAFDGVHLGHREIFRRLVAGARQKKLTPLAITFQPLPREVFGKKQGAIAILSSEERKRRIESCGIKALLVINFTRAFAKKSAKDFMDEVREKLNPELMVIGHDFRFGKEKSADESWIKKYCGRFGMELKVVNAVRIDGQPVSSSRIRALLKAGELEAVTRVSGEPYQLEGEVVAGHHRGKKMGVATANLIWKKELLVPTGIYVAWAGFNREPWPAVINIGYSPTFGDKQLGIEAHLLGFSRELYGKNLRLSLLKRLRDEIKFPDVPALTDQIKKDIAEAKAWLGIK